MWLKSSHQRSTIFCRLFPIDSRFHLPPSGFLKMVSRRKMSHSHWNYFFLLIMFPREQQAILLHHSSSSLSPTKNLAVLSAFASESATKSSISLFWFFSGKGVDEVTKSEVFQRYCILLHNHSHVYLIRFLGEVLCFGIWKYLNQLWLKR